MNELHTKWGIATVYETGMHYVLKGKKYNGKFLHVLIWENFYKCKKPKGFVIHHKNNNPLDNCILNLQLMRVTDHIRLHKTNSKRAPFSLKWIQNISKSMSTSGYFRVCKDKNKNAKQGFNWCYQYVDENGKKRKIRRTSLKELEKVVKSKGLEWRRFSE